MFLNPVSPECWRAGWRAARHILVIALAVAFASSVCELAVPSSAWASAPASKTISGAQQITIGDTKTGGQPGGPVDFWLVELAGGDVNGRERS
jgi:hypothetical protein